jgi:hypothetical protein
MGGSFLHETVSLETAKVAHLKKKQFLVVQFVVKCK